jgi:hypothetical protein
LNGRAARGALPEPSSLFPDWSHAACGKCGGSNDFARQVPGNLAQLFERRGRFLLNLD